MSYYYLIAIAIVFRILLIIVPLWKAYFRFRKKGVLTKLLKVRNLSSLDGIFGFLCIESSLLLVPLTVAGIWRFFKGWPTEIPWSMLQLSIALFCGLLWILVDLNRTLAVNRSLKPLQKWYTHPRAVNTSLEGIIWSRNRLESISKWEIEHPDEFDVEYGSIDSNPIVLRDEEGKYDGIDADVLKQKAEDIKGNAEVFLKKTAHLISETVANVREGVKAQAEVRKGQVDQKLQEKVDGITNSNGRWKDLATDIIMSVYPLIIIYYLLPLFG